MVFHPGHHELHGVTVVVEMTGGVTLVGRFDTEDEAGVHLLNVARHDPATADQPVEEFLARTKKFGVRVEDRRLVLRSAEVRQIRRLAEL
jgi:hypothetical protein